MVDNDNEGVTVRPGRAHGSAMPIQQDADMRVADLARVASVDAAVATGRYGYLHVATGASAWANPVWKRATR